MTETSDEGWRQENNEDHFILGKCGLLSQIKSTVLLRKATASRGKETRREQWVAQEKDKASSERPKLLRSCSTGTRQSRAC